MIRAGQLAPSFRLENLHGGTARMIDLVSRGPLVISFHRGVWCEYCDRALSALADIDQDIRALGAGHVAIGPAPSDETQKRRLLGFPMPVLIDVGLRVAGSYGLAITRPADKAWRIPLPATYLLDRTGKVVLAAIDPDYRNRLSPAEILAAVRCLMARGG